MKNLNIIGLLGAVLTLISAWLPWVKVSLFDQSTTINGFRGDGGNPGILEVAVGVLCIIFFLVNKKWSNITSLILGLCILGLSIKYIGDVKSFDEAASTGMGLYAMAAGGALILVGAIMGMKGSAAKA